MTVPVSDGGGTLTVDGTVAVTNADLTTIAGDTTSIDGKITACNTGAIAGSVTANAGTNLNTSALATAAKQPALGTAGIASADVITVQGIASMTAVKVDNSAVTQPVSHAGLTALNGAIAGTEVQCDVLTMPTTTVTATNLDVRDLTSTDVVTVTGGVGQAADVKVTLDSEAVAVNVRDGSGAAIASTTAGGSQALNVYAYVDGPAQGYEPVGQLNTPILVDAAGALQVDVLTAPETAVTNAGLTALAGAISGSEVQVDIVSGGGAGTQYTEADVDASITGTAIMWEDTGDTLRAVSAAKPLPISDAGGALTVDGTVAVTNAGITTIAGAVAGTEMQCDIVASLPAGTNGIGKLTANSGVDIGDVDVTSVVPGTGATNLGKAEDAAHTSSDTGVFVLGVANTNLATAGSGTTGDYTQLSTTLNGALYTHQGEVFSRTRVTKNIDYTASQTGTTIWDPTAGTTFVVTHITVCATGSGALTIFDNTDAAGNILFEGSLSATGGWDTDYASMHWKSAAADNILKYTSGAGATGSIAVTGYEI